MRCRLSKLALKHIQADNWILLSDQIKVVPELADFLIEEANVANEVACSQRTEDKIVSALTLGLQAECRVADQALTLEEHLEGDRFVEGVREGDFGRSSFSDEGPQVDHGFRLGTIGSDLDSVPIETIVIVLESDRGGVHSAKKRSNLKLVVMSGLGLDLELLLTYCILQISPDCVSDRLVRVILDVKVGRLSLTCAAVDDSMILSQRLFAIALQLILVLLLRRVVPQRQQRRMLHHPGRLESQHKLIHVLLLHGQVRRFQAEIVALLL